MTYEIDDIVWIRATGHEDGESVRARVVKHADGRLRFILDDGTVREFLEADIVEAGREGGRRS